MQGYISDVYEESARALLHGHVADVSTLVESAPTRGNPNEQNIKLLFGSIGFPDILLGLSWNKMSSSSLKKKLREFNELRNRVVHGKSETVRKQQVKNYVSVWTNFAKRLDDKLRTEIKKKTGALPW